MTDLTTIETRLAREGLEVLGGFHPEDGDGVPGDAGTLLLVGPGPGFWDRLMAAPEGRDAAPDPIDRWSLRVLTEIGTALDAAAYFPFGGPPYLPFYSWALRTGRCHASPIQLLVHDEAGLMVSFRGALGLSAKIALPPAPAKPCETCAAPCLDACPTKALGRDGYDVPACKTYLGQPGGEICMTGGCQVRRACPVGTGRQPAAQSQHHMAYFHPPAAKG